MTRRHYSSVAIDNTLGGAIDPTQTAITLGSAWAGAPAVPFTAAIEPGTSNEEVVTVTALSGTSATIARGADDSAGKSHATASVISHRTSARDFDEPNAHVNATTGVHGITGAVVGTSDTQVLTNKTVALGSNTVSGTTAQFNAALTDNDFATLAGAETLTNKSLTDPGINYAGTTATHISRDGAGNIFIGGPSAQEVKITPTGDLVMTSGAFHEGTNFYSSATSTAILSDRYIFVNGGCTTLNLPRAADGLFAGKSVTIYVNQTAGNNVTVTSVGAVAGFVTFANPGGGSATTSSIVLSAGSAVTFMSDGSAYYVVSQTAGGGAWTSYTPTFTNITSGAGNFAYKIVGKTLYLRADFTAGTATANGVCTFSLPSGVTSVAARQRFSNNAAGQEFVVNASDTKVSTTGSVGAGGAFSQTYGNAVIEIA